MLTGNLYGLIITMLTFVITVVLTMRQVEQTGVHFELIIRPVETLRLDDRPKQQVGSQSTASADSNAADGEITSEVSQQIAHPLKQTTP